MTAPALVASLNRKGIYLTADGERLRVNAPRGALTEVEVGLIRAQKPAILAYLSEGTSAGAEGLSERWGPGLTDDGPGLDVHPPVAASEAAEPDPGPGLPDSCFTLWPPRAPELTTWPVGWRARWGRRSAELEAAGYPTWEAERHAFAELVAERIGLGLGAKGIPGERDLAVPAEPSVTPAIEAADARPSRAAALPLKGGR